MASNEKTFLQANVSEIIETPEQMFIRYYMHSDSECPSITQLSSTHREMINKS